MSFLLHIDTSLQAAHCGISKNGVLLAAGYNEEQYSHAAWLHGAVKQVLQQAGIKGGQLSALSVASGPGSYTGVRVSMAAAKGFCYAWNKPLITISNLELIAAAAKEDVPENFLICPMIDARRMEVFTVLYDSLLNKLSNFEAIILNEASFQKQIQSPGVVFCGNGAAKMQSVAKIKELRISEKQYIINHHVSLSQQYFLNSQFVNAAYCEPEYAKAFYTNMVF
jgi:tRNA threonylcarbamoyladenosine biosynthesis protein TsaB